MISIIFIIPQNGGDLVQQKRWIIKFSIHPSRMKFNKLKKTPKPIPRSKYAQQLWEIGAGWKDE